MDLVVDAARNLIFLILFKNHQMLQLTVLLYLFYIGVNLCVQETPQIRPREGQDIWQQISEIDVGVKRWR
jgi:hypothetical protein